MENLTVELYKKGGKVLQRQKQHQTVIVNVGTKTQRRRKRKPTVRNFHEIRSHIQFPSIQFAPQLIPNIPTSLRISEPQSHVHFPIASQQLIPTHITPNQENFRRRIDDLKSRIKPELLQSAERGRNPSEQSKPDDQWGTLRRELDEQLDQSSSVANPSDGTNIQLGRQIPSTLNDTFHDEKHSGVAAVAAGSDIIPPEAQAGVLTLDDIIKKRNGLGVKKTSDWIRSQAGKFPGKLGTLPQNSTELNNWLLAHAGYLDFTTIPKK